MNSPQAQFESDFAQQSMSEEYEARYQQWLDFLWVEEAYTERELEKMDREWARLI